MQSSTVMETVASTVMETVASNERCERKRVDMFAKRIDLRLISNMSLKGKVLLTLMGGVLCAEGAMAYQQLAYAINPCKIEDATRFVTANGGCKDVKTGRVWSRNALSPERTSSFWTWTPAKNYCENLVEGGYTDWRMPTRDELKTVSVNGAGTYLDVFWSAGGPGVVPSEVDYNKWSTTTVRGGKYAYVVALKSGIDTYQWWATDGSSWTDVVCVR